MGTERSGTTELARILDCHLNPGRMTTLGAHGAGLAGLPRTAPELASVVQGLLLHEHWAPAYGVTLFDQRRAGSQLRRVEEMIEHALRLDPHPLATARSLERRLVGVCRHFAVLLVALLRASGTPARARCGFGGYFTPGRWEDHWVCEVWHEADARWVLVDAQLDELQRTSLRIDFDALDVPRDRFLVAGAAWARCRSGDANAADFGIFDLRGLWLVAGNVVRDAAALCGAEMLPWDVWGAMAGPQATLDDASLAFVDRVAELTREPDAGFDTLRALYEADDRLRVPGVVFNALLGRPEAL